MLELRQNSSAYYGPAAAIATMVEAMTSNHARVLPSVCILDGEYGQQDISAGVPAVLGSKGIEKVIELPLDDSEREGLQVSFDSIRTDLQLI